MSPVSPCANPQGYEQSGCGGALQRDQVASPGGPQNGADSPDRSGVASTAFKLNPQAHPTVEAAAPAKAGRGVLTNFPGGMTLDQLRAAYQADADRCSRALADPSCDANAQVIWRRQRIAALRLRDALTAYVQGSLL